MPLTPEQKELRAIARFYKDSKAGFATNDGYYGIPSDGKKIAVVHAVSYTHLTLPTMAIV